MNIAASSMASPSVKDSACAAAMKSVSRLPWSRVWAVGVLVLVGLAVQSAGAQGPLQRLGERIRERAVMPPGPSAGPLAAPNPRLETRRLVRPLRPDSPPLLLPESGLAQSQRVRVGRPPISSPLAPSAAAAGPSQAPALGPPTSDRARRSANFNRARQTSPAQPSSPGEQAPRWQQRGEPRLDPDDAAQAKNPAHATPNAAIDQPRRARLGAVVDTPPEINTAGRPPRRPRGAWVTEVLPQSPAEVAGLQPGDLIVAVEGRVITSVRDLADELSQYAAGDELRVQYSRQDRLAAAAVTLAGPDGLAPQSATDSTDQPADAGGGGSLLGGIGSMFGGLLGGQKQPAATPQQPSSSLQTLPQATPPQPPQSSVETLPAPVPEQ